jgi:hypothetical protein
LDQRVSVVIEVLLDDLALEGFKEHNFHDNISLTIFE